MKLLIFLGFYLSIVLTGCISFPQAEDAYRIQELENEGKYGEAYRLKQGLGTKPKTEFSYSSSHNKRYEKGNSEKELKINKQSGCLF